MKKYICVAAVTFLCGGAPMKATVDITPIFTEGSPRPVGPFSQAIRVKGASETVFISGQLPINSATGVMETEIAAATQQVMRNIEAILQAAGMTFANVVKTTILLTNMNDFATVNKIYESFLTAPYPARATFQVAALPKGACIEIEMIAVR